MTLSRLSNAVRSAFSPVRKLREMLAVSLALDRIDAQHMAFSPLSAAKKQTRLRTPHHNSLTMLDEIHSVSSNFGKYLSWSIAGNADGRGPDMRQLCPQSLEAEAQYEAGCLRRGCSWSAGRRRRALGPASGQTGGAAPPVFGGKFPPGTASGD